MEERDMPLKIVFAGGGTGGHIYPGIAVADSLKALAESKGLSVEIYWIGNGSGMDRDIVEKNLVSAGGSITEFLGIPCGKLRRYFSLRNFVDIFKIAGGFFKSLSLLKKIKPDVLFSKGGFVSVPPCRAAKMLHIPYYTHECDFTPGLATKLNSGGAKNIFVSYEESSKYLKGKNASKCVVTGNPVRPVFYQDNRDAGLEFLGVPKDHEKPILLVLGGSSGALQINNLVVQNITWLKERFIVVHQTGKAFAHDNPLLMASRNDSYKPYDFIYSEMPSVIQASDVVLSRAGANSIWECAVCSKPMVLGPLCGSGTRGDQVDNARFIQQNGAAMALIGKDADSDHLKEALESLLSKEKRDSLSAACKKLCGEKVPSQNIANHILEGLKK